MRSMRTQDVVHHAWSAPSTETRTPIGARYPASVFLIPPTRPATRLGVPIPHPNAGIVATASR
jgi:hypothetical protein